MKIKSIEFIEKIVCEEEDITFAFLHQKTRVMKIRETRQIVLYFAMEYGYSEYAAGNYYGLDHATAHHAKEVVKNFCEVESKFRDKIDKIRGKINNSKKKSPLISILKIHLDISKGLWLHKRINMLSI